MVSKFPSFLLPLSQIDFALVFTSANEVFILLPCSLSLYVLFCVLLSLATGSDRCSIRSVRRVCLSCSVCGRVLFIAVHQWCPPTATAKSKRHKSQTFHPPKVSLVGVAGYKFATTRNYAESTSLTAVRFDTANFSYLVSYSSVSLCQFLCLRFHICLSVYLRYVNSRVVAGRTWWRQCRQSVWQGH